VRKHLNFLAGGNRRDVFSSNTVSRGLGKGGGKKKKGKKKMRNNVSGNVAGRLHGGGVGLHPVKSSITLSGRELDLS